jgi:hypothetical protein
LASPGRRRNFIRSQNFFATDMAGTAGPTLNSGHWWSLDLIQRRSIVNSDLQPASRSTEAPLPPVPPHFSVDTTSLSTVYANFCRVTGTPEELVLDFGLNTQMAPTPSEPVKLTHRLVLNFFTAKRLLGALHLALQQHEKVYGPLEVDISKRVRGTSGSPSSP